ncbi:MAG: agmatinase [Nitrospirae bacterium]|nr:agmatinase [Nitrospirota bacterium]
MKNKTPNNFGGLPAKYSNYKDSKIVILPVPFDKTSSWLKGSAKGPQAIIDASKNMELYDIETNSEVYKKGLHTLKALTADTSKKMIADVYRQTKKLIKDDKFVVTLGGEHTVSLGAIMAHAELFGNFSILHLDAHSDRRDTYEGNRYSHACVMERAGKFTKEIISVGIRSMDSSELKNIDQRKIFYASDIYQGRDWINKAVGMLSDNVYVTIDIDVLDPSIMPSTGTPEPGGMGWYEILALLKSVSEKKRVVGFDVVEFLPSENKSPDFLAAKLIYKLLSFIF